MSSIKCLLFDAAGTLIHKPVLWSKMQGVFVAHGYVVPLEELQVIHKLVSEVIRFPDRTDQAFYEHFNNELLFALGILPTKALLDDLFSACTYQPWEGFEDNKYIKDIDLPKYIISNFSSKLTELIENLIPNTFTDVFISENEGLRKPDVAFYKSIIAKTGFDPSEIVYVGDSLKLDIQPATSLGVKSILIDRLDIFKQYKYRILSYSELKNHI